MSKIFSLDMKRAEKEGKIGSPSDPGEYFQSLIDSDRIRDQLSKRVRDLFRVEHFTFEDEPNIGVLTQIEGRKLAYGTVQPVPDPHNKKKLHIATHAAFPLAVRDCTPLNYEQAFSACAQYVHVFSMIVNGIRRRGSTPHTFASELQPELWTSDYLSEVQPGRLALPYRVAAGFALKGAMYTPPASLELPLPPHMASIYNPIDQFALTEYHAEVAVLKRPVPQR